jgi:hypothetical protein
VFDDIGQERGDAHEAGGYGHEFFAIVHGEATVWRNGMKIAKLGREASSVRWPSWKVTIAPRP